MNPSISIHFQILFGLRNNKSSLLFQNRFNKNISAVYRKYFPLVDYEGYVNYIIDAVNNFLQPNENQRATDRPTPEWAAEQLLQTFQQFQTNITPARITDTIVHKWRKFQHQFCLPEPGDLVSCTIESIDHYANSTHPVLNLKIKNSKQNLSLWIHPSIRPFIDSKILSPSRQIRFLSSQIINDSYLLPIRCIIFELNYGSSSDLQWARSHVQPNLLMSLRSSINKPKAIIVQIVGKTNSSLLIKDDTIHEAIELHLRPSELDYLKLLDENDFIIIWKPIIQTDPFSLELSSETVIFRAPILTTNDGVNQREMMKCGIVDSIVHICNDEEWTGAQVDLIAKNGDKTTVIFSKQTGFDQKKSLSTLKIGHFAYFFHLISFIDSTYRFGPQSIVYNLNIIPSFVDSMVIRPIPIASLVNYTSGVVRAAITHLEIKKVTIHLDCGCVTSNDFCKMCNIDATYRCKKIMEMIITIDDGSENLQVHGLSNMCNLTGIDIQEWKSYEETTKNEIIHSFIGKEYILFLSKCKPIEFNVSEDGFIWRIDTYSEGMEETKRTVRFLIDHLNIKPPPPYQIGDSGASPFLLKS